MSDVTVIRQDPATDRDDKLALLANLPELRIDESMHAKMLDLSDAEWEATVAEAVRVLDILMRDEIREGQAPRQAQQAYRLMGAN
jgi:hypothetical protein